MSIGPREYLRHVLTEAEFLIRSSAGVTREEFMSSEILRRAFVRSLEVIGEASKKVPPEYKELHPHVEGRALAGMRDRLIHGYFGVDHSLVWDVVTTKVPVLRQQVETLLQTSGAQES